MRILAIATLVCVMFIGCQGKTVEPDAVVDVTKNPPAELVGGVVTKDYPEVGFTGGCTATLIKPEWAILAAHCAPNANTTITFTKQDGVKVSRKVSKVFIAPGFRPDAFSLGNDLALVKLVSPITDIVPATYIGPTETPKVGDKITLVGFGLTGTTTTGGTGGAGSKRVGNQVIDNILAPMFLCQIHKGETIGIAQGDSGGPAFATGTRKIMGVCSGATLNGIKKLGVVGTFFFHTRLDIHSQWLTNTIAKN